MGPYSLQPSCFQHVFQPSRKEVALGLSLPINDSSEPLQCRLQVPQAQKYQSLWGGKQEARGQQGSAVPGVPGLEAVRRPQTLLTHLQQEGNSQHVAQCACQPLQVPQQHLVASLGPEVEVGLSGIKEGVGVGV